MTCRTFPMDSGGTAIVCGLPSQKRCECGRASTLLCDWKVPKRKSGTCDRPICAHCSTSPAHGKDLCPAHAAEFKAWQEARANATPPIPTNPARPERDRDWA